ncbi:recombinase RecT [Roseibium sp.]|uniref:recombinase RecT n=1 Tax=Roseibium sp. TaxID=1936156 RepID=UPI003BA95ED9
MSNQKTGNALAVIEDLQGEVAPLLAENNQSWDRLRSTLVIAVQQNADILKCSPESIRREVMKCASDGLVPDNKQATLLPYWDKDQKVHVLNYQPMVHGIIKRMKELGGVFSIVVALVHAKDQFQFDEADLESLSHKSNPFDKDRGEIVGGYCIFRDESNRVIHREVMSVADFEKVRLASKAPNSPAWRNWYGEMCKKAVLRRGSKYISINNDKIRQLVERQDALFDFRAEQAQRERVNPFTGEVIDATSSAPQIENKPSQPAETGQPKAAPKTNGKAAPKSQKNGSSGQPRQTDAKQEKKPEQQTKPAAPAKPVMPDVFIDDEVTEVAKDMAEKILGMATLQDATPAQRREQLTRAAQAWKSETPQEIHALVKFCVDAADYCIKTDAAGGEWLSDLTVFAMKVAEALGVDKLSI